MEGLFNPLSILLHTLNAAILLVAVYFLLYKPVRKFLIQRADKVNQQLDDASKAQSDAQAALAQSHEQLAQTDRMVADKLTEGQRLVQKQQEQLLDSAREEAARIVAQARQDAERMMSHANEAMQAQAAQLAVEIAAAVLGREVKSKDHQMLIQDFLKKVG